MRLRPYVAIDLLAQSFPLSAPAILGQSKYLSYMILTVTPAAYLYNDTY